MTVTASHLRRQLDDTPMSRVQVAAVAVTALLSRA